MYCPDAINKLRLVEINMVTLISDLLPTRLLEGKGIILAKEDDLGAFCYLPTNNAAYALMVLISDLDELNYSYSLWGNHKRLEGALKMRADLIERIRRVLST